MQNIIYSLLLGLGFRSIGRGFYIEYPARLSGGKYIVVGNNFSCFSGIRMEAISEHNGSAYSPEIIFGTNVSINFDCHIACVNKIIIDSNVLIASKVFITDHYHGEICKESLALPPSLRKVQSPGPVHIEENVWIGEGVAVMPNVRIGRNSIIGANSVVTKNIPPNCVAAGVPARVIKYLS